MITAKIDVTKIDKNKLFAGKEKDGKIPKYLDIVLIENRDGPDQWGNHYMVVQSVSKEEREAGIRGAILGNAKIIGGKKSAPSPTTQRQSEPTNQAGKKDVPF